MFKAIGRFFRALGYLFTGNLDKAAEALRRNPVAFRASYEEVIDKKRDRAIEFKNALARMIAQSEKKRAAMETVASEIEETEKLNAGALGKARQLLKSLQDKGKSQEEIKLDPEYIKCQNFYQDFSSSLDEKKKRLQEINETLGNIDELIRTHRAQLNTLVTEIENLKDEAAHAEAEVIAAEEQRKINDVVAGLQADDGSAEAELKRLRDMRLEIKAEAKVSAEMAGSEVEAQKAEFLDYAQNSEAAKEFDSLLFNGGVEEIEAAKRIERSALDAELEEDFAAMKEDQGQESEEDQKLPE